MNHKRKLQAGLVKPFRSKPYLDWVKAQTCPCGNPADEAHHAIDIGLGGAMGSKLGDEFTFPVCRSCHNLIHQCSYDWEDKYGMQTLWVCLTLSQAISEGVIEI